MRVSSRLRCLSGNGEVIRLRARWAVMDPDADGALSGIIYLTVDAAPISGAGRRDFDPMAREVPDRSEANPQVTGPEKNWSRNPAGWRPCRVSLEHAIVTRLDAALYLPVELPGAGQQRCTLMFGGLAVPPRWSRQVDQRRRGSAQWG